MKKSTITEKDLVALGFKKINVSAEESGDAAYYYYTKDFWKGRSNFCLISTSSDDVKKKGWVVEYFEEPRLRFTDSKSLKLFVFLIEEIKSINKKSK